ncbi:MAG: diadenylate cyclase CdaA [Lactovum sp.]
MNNIPDLFNTEIWHQLVELNKDPWQFFISFVDILIVSFIIYKLIRFVEGTRMLVLVRGVFFFIIASLLAELMGLVTLTWLLNQVLTYGVIALIVIFQPEIRQALERLGHTTKFIGKRVKEGTDKQINAYVKAFEHMSKRKIGVLIAIERTQTLAEYANTGIRLDADITSELLINIFIPNTPLHDGAVIIQENKIVSSSAYLPLTDRVDISKKFGTRHRAAIGLAELSDAIVLVISEETGNISIAHHGIFYSDLTLEKFRQILSTELIESPKEEMSLFQSLFKKAKKEEI